MGVVGVMRGVAVLGVCGADEISGAIVVVDGVAAHGIDRRRQLAILVVEIPRGVAQGVGGTGHVAKVVIGGALAQAVVQLLQGGFCCEGLLALTTTLKG